MIVKFKILLNIDKHLSVTSIALIKHNLDNKTIDMPIHA